MASKYLDGSMVPRKVTRHWDQRLEPRNDAGSEEAVLEFRGRKYRVGVVNQSPSGAMLIFSLIPCIGETISVELDGRGVVPASVCWVRDGKIGVAFAVPAE